MCEDLSIKYTKLAHHIVGQNKNLFLHLAIGEGPQMFNFMAYDFFVSGISLGYGRCFNSGTHPPL
jgi:hypothetical protein